MNVKGKLIDELVYIAERALAIAASLNPEAVSLTSFSNASTNQQKKKIDDSNWYQEEY